MADRGNSVGEDQPHSTDATPAFVLPDGLFNALRSFQSRARQYPAAKINDPADEINESGAEINGHSQTRATITQR